MLEDIKLGLKIWDNQNDVEIQTTDMRSIVYQTAANFERESIEHVRTLLSLIDKCKNKLEEISNVNMESDSHSQREMMRLTLLAISDLEKE